MSSCFGGYDIMGVSLVELIQSDKSMSDVNSVDKSLMEKLRLMKALNDEERKTIYTMQDTFIGKKKLKDAFSNVLHDVH